jgi:hypothetical protein
LRPPPRRLRPVLAIVIPPELADSDTPAVLWR